MFLSQTVNQPLTQPTARYEQKQKAAAGARGPSDQTSGRSLTSESGIVYTATMRGHSPPMTLRVEFPPMPGLPEEARPFVVKERVGAYLPLAVGLMRKLFPEATGWRWEFEGSRETDEEWLALHFHAQGDLEGVLDRYDQLTDLWVARAPWPQADRIRFAFTTD